MKQHCFYILFLLLVTVNLSAQVFDYVVSKDGTGDFFTLNEAINAAPDNDRKIIFVKAGIYDEKVMIGSHSKTSSKILSIIGENPDEVIISQCKSA